MKTKEMLLGFRRSRNTVSHVTNNGADEEMKYRYQGENLHNKLEWTNAEVVNKKGLSGLYFHRRLRSFSVCSQMLQMFCQSVVESACFYAEVCWAQPSKCRAPTGRINQESWACGWLSVGPPSGVEDADLWAITDNTSHVNLTIRNG